MQLDTTIIKNKISNILMLVMLGLCITMPVNLQAANYDSGIFEFQKKLAKGGSPRAQYQLATMYETGRGVAKNINKAKEWYKKSAANNFTAASHRLIYIDVKGSGFKASHKPWFKDLVNDAKNGDGEAMFILGDMNENGIGVKKNLDNAQKYYKSSSGTGNLESEHRLYNVEQKLKQKKADKRKKKEAQQKAKAARAEEEAAKKRKADQARKTREAKAAKENSAKNSKLKAEQERKKLEAERQQLAKERRKLEAQSKALEEKEAAAQKAIQDKKENEQFESDLCSGRAARFRTQCK